MNAGVAFNTATSFMTNTNWQYYGGEATMSYLSQMAGLAVQNFISAAVGMAVARRRDPRLRSAQTAARQLLGRPHRTLPSSCCRSALSPVFLVCQGVPDTFHGHAVRTPSRARTQSIARGPVASQVAIKQLGTNGGGFFNTNSAAPFENPNGLPISSR